LITKPENVFREIDLIVEIFLVGTNIDPEKNKVEFDKDLLKFCVDETKLMMQGEEFHDKLNVIGVLYLKENNQ
jgi:hypothetical protein